MSDISTSGPVYRVVNPATGEVVETFDYATDAEVEAALAAVQRRTAYGGTCRSRSGPRRSSGSASCSSSDGRSWPPSRPRRWASRWASPAGEAEFCGEIFDYFATEGPGLAADQPIKTFSGGKAVVQRLPIGPLLGIMPWNYPFYQIARFAAPNLVLGNTIMLKHAESVPKSALAVQQIMDDAGLPEGVYVNVFATHGQIEQIIADPRIAGVSLTGSERAGSVVAAIAGKNLKKCVLELGGSDPYVVLDTDDVEAAADLAWETRISNTGQACNSNKRMIVMDDIFDDFVAQLTERAKDLAPGTRPRGPRARSPRCPRAPPPRCSPSRSRTP